MCLYFFRILSRPAICTSFRYLYSLFPHGAQKTEQKLPFIELRTKLYVRKKKFFLFSRINAYRRQGGKAQSWFKILPIEKKREKNINPSIKNNNIWLRSITFGRYKFPIRCDDAFYGVNKTPSARNVIAYLINGSSTHSLSTIYWIHFQRKTKIIDKHRTIPSFLQLCTYMCNSTLRSLLSFIVISSKFSSHDFAKLTVVMLKTAREITCSNAKEIQQIFDNSLKTL